MIKKYLIKYSIEFIVIILGITVSFWLNEFSLNSQNEKERVKVLIGLQSEINEIRNYCTQRKATWKIDMNILDILNYIILWGREINKKNIINICLNLIN